MSAKHERHEIVKEYERVTGDVWGPVEQFEIGPTFVTRCRDCKWYVAEGMCQQWASDPLDGATYEFVDPDGFCSWAIPREVDQ